MASTNSSWSGPCGNSWVPETAQVVVAAPATSVAASAILGPASCRISSEKQASAAAVVSAAASDAGTASQVPAWPNSQ